MRARVLAAVAVAGVAALAVVPGAGAADSSSEFLSRSTITLPPRSTIIDSVDRTAGCGTAPSTGGIAVDGDPSDWRATPTMISGTGRYDAGEYVWTDYAYDDDGTGTLEYPGQAEALIAAPGTAGKAPPREQRYGSNAADVIELRTAADADTLYALVRLNFLNAVDSTVVGLALDTDADAATGAAEWPRGAGMSTPGSDVFITAYGECGYVQTAAGERTIAAAGGAIAVSTRHNVIELAIPRTLLGGAARLRLAGGAGLWDAQAKQWMRPSLRPSAPGSSSLSGNRTDGVVGASGTSDPGVFNLLFRGDEGLTTSAGPRAFQTDKQNAVLKTNSSGGYRVDLQLERLLEGAASDPLIQRRGSERAFTRIYRSRSDAEGVIVQGQYAVFLGRYEPYGAYVPACYEQGCARWPSSRPPGVVIVHGGSGSHIGMLPGGSGGVGGGLALDVTAAYAGMDAGFAPLVVTAMGRGQRPPWWRGLGEADVLELRDAAQRAYGPDTERWVITGGSLGGYGTIRLASLYPDTWTGAFAHCPAEFEDSIGPRDVGNVEPTTQNFVIDPVMAGMFDLPFRQANGTLDPLVPIATGHRLRDSALAGGLDYHYTEYLVGGHCWDNLDPQGTWIANHVSEYRALASRTREVNPARVRYAIDPRHFPADPEPIGLFDIRDVGIRYQGVYWVSGLQLRAGAAQAPTLSLQGNFIGGAGADVVGTIDAASHALPGRQVGARSCGSGAGIGAAGNPELSPAQTPNTYLCQAQTRTDALEPVLDLRAQRLAATTIDVDRAGLARAAEITINATGDGPLALRLTGAAGRLASGRCVSGAQRDGNDLVIALGLDAVSCPVRVKRGIQP